MVHSTSGRVYAVYKLFEDTSHAFVRGALPESGEDGYRWLQVSDVSQPLSQVQYTTTDHWNVIFNYST